MRGQVGVVSAPGRGSTFWVTITLDQPAAAPPPPAADARLAGRRALIVDDSAASREIWSITCAAGAWRPRAPAVAPRRWKKRAGPPWRGAL